MRVSTAVEVISKNDKSKKGMSDVNVVTPESTSTSINREKSLFNALANGISKNHMFYGMLFPKNTFPENSYVTSNDTIIIPTSISFKDSLVLTDRYFFPFTNTGELVGDFVNGCVELYPNYHVLVADHSSKMQNNEYDVTGGLNVVGIYHLDSAEYDAVYMNENGNVLSSREYSEAIHNDDIVITRYLPRSYTSINNEIITAKMREYVF